MTSQNQIKDGIQAAAAAAAAAAAVVL